MCAGFRLFRREKTPTPIIFLGKWVGNIGTDNKQNNRKGSKKMRRLFITLTNSWANVVLRVRVGTARRQYIRGYGSNLIKGRTFECFKAAHIVSHLLGNFISFYIAAHKIKRSSLVSVHKVWRSETLLNEGYGCLALGGSPLSLHAILTLEWVEIVTQRVERWEAPTEGLGLSPLDCDRGAPWTNLAWRSLLTAFIGAR